VRVKRAVKSGGNWKRRFFVLGENSLTYYTDEAGARRGTSPKGDILFTADSTVSPRDVESIAFCFAIVTPEKTLYVAAQGEAEMADWIAAVRASIEALSTSAHRGKRGYLTKRAVVSGGNWKRRFFLLSSDRLSYYKSDKTTTDCKGTVMLTRGTRIETTAADAVTAAAAAAHAAAGAGGAGGGDDAGAAAAASFAAAAEKNPHCFAVVAPSKTLYVAAANDAEKTAWVAAVQAAIELLPEAPLLPPANDGGAGGAGGGVGGGADESGYLVKRAVISGENWKARWFVLRGASLAYYKVKKAGPSLGPSPLRCFAASPCSASLASLFFFLLQGRLYIHPLSFSLVVSPSTRSLASQDETALQPKGEFVLTPDSTVYETNLRPFAFELVTSGKVRPSFAPSFLR
jgi:hypothetical protein